MAYGHRHSALEPLQPSPKPTRGGAGSFAVRVTTSNPTAGVNVGASAFVTVAVHMFQFEGTARRFARDAELRAITARLVPGVEVTVEFLRDVGEGREAA